MELNMILAAAEETAIGKLFDTMKAVEEELKKAIDDESTERIEGALTLISSIKDEIKERGKKVSTLRGFGFPHFG